MGVIFNLQVDRLYDIVRRKQSGGYLPAVHYHVDCGLSFSCLWPIRTIGCGVIPDPVYADNFICPHCGEHIDVDESYIADGSGRGEYVPLSLKLSINDRGHILDVVFDYTTIYFDGDAGIYTAGYKPHVIDVLRFDFKTGEAYLVQKKRTRADVVNRIDPHVDRFNSYSLPLFRLTATNNCRLSLYKNELKQFAKLLKQAFFSKLSKRVGYTVKPFRQSVQVGNKRGLFVSLLHNLVWKLHAPDAPALNDEMRRDYDSFYVINFAERNAHIDRIVESTGLGIPWIRALIEEHQLPNTRWVRRLMTTRPFFYIRVIEVAKALFKSSDYQKAFIDLVEQSDGGTSYIQLWPIWRSPSEVALIAKFMTILRHQYGERRAFLFIKNLPAYTEIRDTAAMYFELSRAHRKELWGKRIQLKDLHDEISCMTKFDKEADVPVQQRKVHTVLADTISDFVFSPARSTHEIIGIGVKLRNCVGSYINKVKAESCTIVGVYRDDALIACIEVSPENNGRRFTEIRQAKLKENKAVFENHDVNAAINEWMKRHHLTVAPYVRDIRFQEGGAI